MRLHAHEIWEDLTKDYIIFNKPARIRMIEFKTNDQCT